MVNQEPNAERRSSSGGKSSKIRDTCHACARSKVRCPKEKPSCSRCESRGSVCQYLFTRRPGRRPENSTRHRSSISDGGVSTKSSSNSNTDTDSMDTDTIQVVQPSIGVGSATTNTPPSTDMPWKNSYLDITPGMSIPTSPVPDNIFAANFSGVFSTLGDTSLFSGFADFGSDINGTDSVTLATNSPFGIPTLDSGSTAQAPNGIRSLLIPADSINFDLSPSETSSTVDFTSLSSAVSLESPNASKVQAQMPWLSRATYATDTSSCSCLKQALDLLQTLSSAQSRAKFASPDTSETPDTVSVSCAQSALKENQQSIEAVSSLLACLSCAWDSFLLTVLSMIVLKILERYSATARIQAHGPTASEVEAEKTTRLANSIISSSQDQIKVLNRIYNAPRDEKGRGLIAAQLVLGELHRVQRLVNQLSIKLKGSKEREDPSFGPEMDFWTRHKAAGDGENTTAARFSAGTLDQMESDVRRALSNLSAEIIKGIRRS